MNFSECVHRQKQGRECNSGSLIFIIPQEKGRQNPIFIFQNQPVKHVSVGLRIKLNLDLSGAHSLLHSERRQSQIYPSDETLL